MTRTIALLILMNVSGCDNAEPQSAKEIFETRLGDLGVAYEIDENGLYAIKLNGNTLTVSLENVAKNYERDGDSGTVFRFADQVARDFNEPTPDWETVQANVRFSLEPDDYAVGFDSTLHTRIDDELIKVFVYTPEDGSRITWISKDTVIGWGVTRDEVIAMAEKNMRKIASEAEIVVQEGNGVTLGMISTEESPFKASLLLADNFRALVEPKLGFPVFAVAPSRDFVFLIPHKDRDQLGRVGTTVIKQYNNSGHSVTMNVLEVTDEGISVIGTFEPPSTEPDAAGQPATRPLSE